LTEKAEKELKKPLRSWDDQFPDLDPARAHSLKQAILEKSLRAPLPTPKRTTPHLLLPASLALALLLLLWWHPWQAPTHPPDRPVLQTANKNPNPFQRLHSQHVRELQFTTPKGTRIIWQFKTDQDEVHASQRKEKI